jgi:hypothetical protein
MVNWKALWERGLLALRLEGPALSSNRRTLSSSAQNNGVQRIFLLY